jgi:SAM-dependent methyltransferase
MSGFTADWLALREPADARARRPGTTVHLLPKVASLPVRIVDLGSGTGANCRYLAPWLGPVQDWLLVDNDGDLLARAVVVCGGLDGIRHVETLKCDLLTGLTELPLAGAALVTASALLDLVSEPWLTQLAERCRMAQIPALFALSYDGRVSCSPADSDDSWIRDALNAHQRRDKGFGPALGPIAAARARLLFESCGHVVASHRSDWVLGPEDGTLQRALLEGWASAAAEQEPADTVRAAQWLRRRLAWIEAGCSRLIVGHEDLLALPPKTLR